MSEVEHYVDLSNHNDPTIDWRAAAADGLDGGWIKLTQATNFVDGLADDYVATVKGAMPLGGYFFGDHRYDAHQQARMFFDRAQELNLLDPDDLAVMYDVENWTQGNGVNVVWPNRQTIAHHVNVWLDEAVRRGVRRALVYGSLSWWLSGLLNPADYERDDIEVLNWIAVFNGDPGNVGSWSHPRDALHQHTSSGIVPGIDGRVDKNTTLRGRTRAGLTNGGDGVSKQDVYDAFAAMADPQTDEDVQAAENFRKIATQYLMPKAPAVEIEYDEDGNPTNATTIHDEARWATPNSEAILAAVEKLSTGTGYTLKEIGEAVAAQLRADATDGDPATGPVS